MIGIVNISGGRMGNRLFHYNFLRQIARKTGTEYFHETLPDNAFFKGMERRKKEFKLFKKKIVMTSKDVLVYKPDEFIGFVNDENLKGNTIIFDPPMLGEVFFDFLYFPPNDFFEIREQYMIGFGERYEGRFVIGVHFRGTDFYEWNRQAVLDFSYYKAAIDFCVEYFSDKKPVFALFTDDTKFETYMKTSEYLKSEGREIIFGDIDKPPIDDFYKLSISDVIISSPSTFSIFAGCIGKENKKIIHEKKWIEYEAEKKDTFWTRLKTADNPYYSLWKTF